MRVIEPYHFQKPKRKKRFNAWRIPFYLFLSIMIVLLVVGSALYFMPVPKLSAKTSSVKLSAEQVSIAWPTYGQSAVGAVGYGLLEKNNADKAAPIASITKAITAMAILEKMPLGVSESGPSVTFTASDVDLFNQYLAKNGSVVPVSVGSTMTQRQALEAILLASANNVADSTAIWAFGSVDAYKVHANAMVKKLGMTSTQIDDASGFSPNSVSTASDLVLLGETLLNQPVLAQIVNQKTAQLPIGPINNTNRALGVNGVVGIKTGNTDEAGGCYLVAVKRVINGQDITVIGAVLGATTLGKAITDGQTMANSTFSGFGTRKIVNQGQGVGYYELPNGQQLLAIAQSDMTVFGWLNKEWQAEINLDNLNYPVDAGKQVGVITFNKQTQTAVAGSSVAQPSLGWRLTRWL